MQDAHVIITGGSSGIGFALAVRYVALGARVTLIARRQVQLDCAVSQLGAEQASGIACDVTDKPALTAAIRDAIARWGTPEVLITSAGMAHPGLFSQLDDAVFENSLATNYLGTLWAIRAVYPAMKIAGKGQILLVSSGAALIGVYGYTPYAPTKYALRGLAESLRTEARRDGIKISILYPPDTDTPQLAQENRTKPPATKQITATAKVYSADVVADVALRGLARGRFAITPGLELTLLYRLNSFIVPILNPWFDRIVARRAP